MQLHSLSRIELIKVLQKTTEDEREILVCFIRYLAEAERRDLFVYDAKPSLFAWLTETFKMSEASASRRIAVARLYRKLPQTGELMLELLASGKVNLEALASLWRDLNEDNAARLLAEIQGKSRRQLDEIIARNFPGRVKKKKKEYARTVVLDEEDVKKPTDVKPQDGTSSPQGVGGEREPVIEPASIRLGIELRVTIAGEDAEALKRLRELYPGMSYQELIGQALQGLLKKKDPQMRAQKVAQADVKEEGVAKIKKRKAIPEKVRLFVYHRDGGRCTFTNEAGERCSATGNLEIDHITPVARGGTNEPENLRLMCRAHNNLQAEWAFGREFVQNKKTRGRASPGNHDERFKTANDASLGSQ